MGRSRVRNPTRAEKEMISAAGLKARNWYVLRYEENGDLLLISKGTGRSRRIRKEKNDEKRRI